MGGAMDTREEPRRQIATESPFNPVSLMGSWAMFQQDDEPLRILLVVGEPATSTNPLENLYLVEEYDVVTDEPKHQRLMRMAEFMETVEDGDGWRFYDDHASVRQAFREVMA